MFTSDNNTTTTNKFPSDSDLADFHLELYSKAREKQAMRSGLLSNSDAIRTAAFEHFAKGFLAMSCAMGHVRLFGGDTKDEQLQDMVNYARAASSDLSSSTSTKQAANIVETMLDSFSADFQMQMMNDKTKAEKKNVMVTPGSGFNQARSKDEEECATP